MTVSTARPDAGTRTTTTTRHRSRRPRPASSSNAPTISPSVSPSTPDGPLADVTGILDILDSYGFVRTSGYLAGPNDVYVSPAQIRQYGLRRGDEITGAFQPGPVSDSRKQNNRLARLDTVNGMDPDEARRRPSSTS
jgi:transcription termination factor Rho